MSKTFETIADAALALGVCDRCPIAQTLFIDMNESGAGVIPEEYQEDARLALRICIRAQQIARGVEPTSEPLPGRYCPPRIAA